MVDLSEIVVSWSLQVNNQTSSHVLFTFDKVSDQIGFGSLKKLFRKFANVCIVQVSDSNVSELVINLFVIHLFEEFNLENGVVG